MRILAAGLMVLFLSGCGGPAYSGPGPVDVYTRASYECERDTRMAGEFMPGPFGLIPTSFFQRCMEAKGYSRVR